MAKSLAVSGKIPTFVPMKHQEQWVITGKNVLTGHREELSRPMAEQDARDRLSREMESRRRQRYQPYKQLRVEKRLPVQLTIQFNDHE